MSSINVGDDSRYFQLADGRGTKVVDHCDIWSNAPSIHDSWLFIMCLYNFSNIYQSKLMEGGAYSIAIVSVILLACSSWKAAPP